MPTATCDAVVVGSGPNGLAAAARLALAGLRVRVMEAAPVVGGGLRTEDLTEPGFRSDVCSTVQALLPVSPFLARLPLQEHGLEMITPPAPFGAPLADGSAVVAERSIDSTAAGLGADGPAYRRLLGPFHARDHALFEELLGPLRLPRHPVLLAGFGAVGVPPAALVQRALFRSEAARTLLAGVAAHAAQPLTRLVTSSFALALLLSAHRAGWPVAAGGSGQVAAALVSYLGSLGVEVETSAPVGNVDDLPPARAVLLDLTPRQLLRVAPRRWPDRYRRHLERYRYGAGVFKLDWSLEGPIPWLNRELERVGTVHLGGTSAEIERSEAAVGRGEVSERPFVILVQPTRFDPSRAPAGKHVAWAYCHVPNGARLDMTTRIEAQVERYAPGFLKLVRRRSVLGPEALEQHNPNYVGGDINGGVQDLGQLYFRPAPRRDPYTTPDPQLYICSSATPPGGGVHGMCGYHAAGSALRRLGAA